MNLGVRWLLCVLRVRVLHSGCGSGLFVFLVECRLLLPTLRAGVGRSFVSFVLGGALVLGKRAITIRAVHWMGGSGIDLAVLGSMRDGSRISGVWVYSASSYIHTTERLGGMGVNHSGFLMTTWEGRDGSIVIV
jgi:hypothetical protein